jgi:hypothetical protein
MKAIIYTKYGSLDVLQFTEVEKPTPKANEVFLTALMVLQQQYFKPCFSIYPAIPPG